MNSPLLRQLATDDFADGIGFVLPPAPLRRVLQQSPEVRRLGAALRYGQVTGEDIREFVDRLLSEYRPGELFRYDLTLAALAVAMEHWSSSFAEDYLIDLARIQRLEFRASFRVARESLKARFAFPRTRLETSRYPRTGLDPVGPPGHIRAMPCGRPNQRETIGRRTLRYSEVGG